MNGFTIGALAEAAGVGVETIRYYQRRGLMEAPNSRRGAFRVYGRDELARLRFIRRAQALGFSLEEVAALMALDEETDRVKARQLALAKIEDVELRIRRLQEMRSALLDLVDCCEHTQGPLPCPILHSLAREADD